MNCYTMNLAPQGESHGTGITSVTLIVIEKERALNCKPHMGDSTSWILQHYHHHSQYSSSVPEPALVSRTPWAGFSPLLNCSKEINIQVNPEKSHVKLRVLYHSVPIVQTTQSRLICSQSIGQHLPDLYFAMKKHLAGLSSKNAAHFILQLVI